jgi:ABC-type polysaccharide/polyol phosphate export permease
MVSANLVLLNRLVGRELNSKFVGSASGWIWIALTPLLLLAVYGFVFGVIFRARAPVDLDIPFIAWLAAALWPWLAFSDGVLRGSDAIRQHANLISKVSIPRVLLPISVQTSAFLLQLIGYVVVLVAFLLAGVEVTWQGLPYAGLVLCTLYGFSLGLAILVSAVQVYIRDLEQLLPTLLMFWFFLTPILYAPELLPEEMLVWLNLNPLTWWMTEIRAALFQGKLLPDLAFLPLLAVTAAALVAGYAMFFRLNPYFEDFL